MRSHIALLLLLAAHPAGAQVRNDTLRLFTVHAPPELARTDTVLGQRPDWGAQPPEGGLSARLVLADDGFLGLACEPILNASEVAGQIAFIRRGVCEFPLKAWHAQEAGAIAFVVYQGDLGVPPECTPEVLMGPGTGSYPPITIPGAFLEYCDASPIVAALLGGAEVTVTIAPFLVGVLREEEPGGSALGLGVEPNPASGPAAVRFRLDDTEGVRVAVVDPLGREVALLHDGILGAGGHALALDAARLPPGVYWVRAMSPRLRTSRAFNVVR
jgi:hypothetical protein